MLYKMLIVSLFFTALGCKEADPKNNVDYWLKEATEAEFSKTLAKCRVGNNDLEYCSVVMDAYKIKKQSQAENSKQILKNKLSFDR